MKWIATAAAWFSTFSENGLVTRVKRRIPIRIVRLFRFDVRRADVVRVAVAGGDALLAG